MKECRCRYLHTSFQNPASVRNLSLFRFGLSFKIKAGAGAPKQKSISDEPGKKDSITENNPWASNSKEEDKNDPWSGNEASKVPAGPSGAS